MKTQATAAKCGRVGWKLMVVAASVGGALVGCAAPAPEAHISACGGFSQQEQGLTIDRTSYCDAEVLHWQYDAASEKLTLANTRVTLNCCGEHSLTVEQEGDISVVTERDAPEEIGPLPGMTARCDCMCVFDFEVAVGEVQAGTLALKLVRDVTDAEGGPTTAWQGEIDVAAGQGEVVIDASESMWCQASAS